MNLQVLDQAFGEGWALYNGDSCQAVRGLPDDSVDLSLFSPPFANIYIYSDSAADMGNAANGEEFFAHFRFLAAELHRITRPGRLVVFHCKDLPLYKGRDGAAGLSDFPGQCIRLFEECGFTYHTRVTIWKDPVIEMQRTKNHGLLYKNLRADSCASRQGMADYVIGMRAWKDEERWKPVAHERVAFPLEQWQNWASPVWMDIKQPNVLNHQLARDNEDERHICPLQLDLIERCITLWSNPGELVFDPFTGIGSTGVVALKLKRRFLGVELKESYFNLSVKHLKAAELAAGQRTLFDGLDEEDRDAA